MVAALDDFGIDKVAEIKYEIYDSGEIPSDLSTSIFIAIPKKQEQLSMKCTEPLA